MSKASPTQALTCDLGREAHAAANQSSAPAASAQAAPASCNQMGACRGQAQCSAEQAGKLVFRAGAALKPSCQQYRRAAVKGASPSRKASMRLNDAPCDLQRTQQLIAGKLRQATKSLT